MPPAAAAGVLHLTGAQNLVLGLGVSKRAPLDLQSGAAPDEIFRFFERWGGAWGARPDVIRRAAPAAVELCEEIWSLGGPADIAIEIVFDELRLSVDLEWSVSEAHRDESAYERLAGHLQRRYDCRARLRTDAASRLMHFDFEH